ncbi:hypothetical protein [Paenibacillus sp. MMS20-IR301]|uniref:glycosyltransferase family 2 protein n=1 Tax=Paenibacillus sp. MMS20-IR301 TaxID=2895946 RepID=UPI0028E90D12|nr:hypothetical protein [Paenibacillus sp. MMS20-IR301]WNS43529.1 hypothetical protein LOS79_32110 [Paenibacillus sp. MMS20-IR301]
MKKVKLVFVVLTFRNAKDLIDLLKSIEVKVNVSYKVIIINSYYDELSADEIKLIADSYDCDFLNVPNKGYGAGNNKGITYAKENYSFNFLIICNPDTVLINFDYVNLVNKEGSIIGPEITSKKGTKQNPFKYFDAKILDLITYFGFLHNNIFFVYISIVVNKIIKIFLNSYNNILQKKEHKTYSCHGSFVIFGTNALDKLGKPYNEKMFLFCEEDHVAKLAKEKKVETIINHSLQIYHKEDGSMNLVSNIVTSKHLKESYIEFYKYWYKTRLKEL